MAFEMISNFLIGRFNDPVGSQAVTTVVNFAVENNIIVNAPNVSTAFQGKILNMNSNPIHLIL